jgi:hypothetical protein
LNHPGETDPEEDHAGVIAVRGATRSRLSVLIYGPVRQLIQWAKIRILVSDPAGKIRKLVERTWVRSRHSPTGHFRWQVLTEPDSPRAVVVRVRPVVAGFGKI